MIRLSLIGAVLALLVSGCGNESGDPEPARDGAALLLKHVVDGPPLYIEGSIWHVRVVGSDGAPVLDRQLSDDSVSVSVEPGRYELESEEFPCNGNCGNLAPGTDRCSTKLVVDRGQKLAAIVRLRPTKGCVIEFDPEPGT
jgi:hypothetical protein